jgi:hypothetical protein
VCVVWCGVVDVVWYGVVWVVCVVCVCVVCCGLGGWCGLCIPPHVFSFILVYLILCLLTS